MYKRRKFTIGSSSFAPVFHLSPDSGKSRKRKAKKTYSKLEQSQYTIIDGSIHGFDADTAWSPVYEVTQPVQVEATHATRKTKVFRFFLLHSVSER